MDTPTKEDLPKIAEKYLGSYEDKKDLLNKSGGILYSSHKTIKPGDIYFLGYNPGGSGECVTKSRTALTMPSIQNEDNNYLDEDWENKQGESQQPRCALTKKNTSAF